MLNIDPEIRCTIFMAVWAILAVVQFFVLKKKGAKFKRKFHFWDTVAIGILFVLFATWVMWPVPRGFFLFITIGVPFPRVQGSARG